MTVAFELPDVGEGVAEGELLEWHVEPGDVIEEDQLLAVVETDKATVDLPSPVAGTVRELHAGIGDVVPVGDVLVTIDADGDADAVEEAAGVVEDAGETDADEDPTDRVFAPPRVRRLARELGVDAATLEGSGPGGRVTENDVRAAAGPTESGEDTTTVPEGADEAAEDTGDESQSTAKRDGTDPETGKHEADSHERKSAVGHVDGATDDRDRTLAVPATRALADELGVDIDAVPTEKTRNGEAFVEESDVRACADARAAPGDDAGTAATEATGADAAAPDPGGGAPDAKRVTREPYRGIRRTVGEQMQRSASTVPHATHHDTAVVPDLVEAKGRLAARADDRGVRLTYLPFVLKAVVAGLQEYPVLNSTLDEDAEEIVYREYYDIGVAVATDAGLVVPVVEGVDGKGLLEVAAEVNDLAERARERDLQPAELQGGTFTVTNFGAIGGEYATPIVNHPETAILGLGRIEKRPVVVDGEVVARHTLPLSLSIDHRVVDGAEAARFANTVIESLEEPALLLLE